MAIILGIAQYNPTIQGTEEWDKLADELDTFAVDYYPYHYNYVSLDLIGATIIVIGEVASETNTINAGIIDASYLTDFYFRIHLEPRIVDLGVVLSAQIYSVNIWNAWFNQVILNSINEVNLPDVNTNFPYTIPYTFNPLENVQFDLNIDEFGVPIIEGYFNFIFNSPFGTYALIVQGQRAILWAFPPNSDFTERREWLTDIISARSSEERLKVREYPRLNLDYTYTFRGREDFCNAREFASNVSQYALTLPYWAEATKLFNITPGNTISIDTTYLEIEVNSLAILFVDYKTTEVLQITGITSNSITLQSPIVGTYEMCWFVPTYTGYSNGGIQFSEGANHRATCQLSFTSPKCYVDETYYTPEVTYKSIPIWTETSVVTGGLTGKYERNQLSFDSSSGSFIKLDDETYNRMMYTLRVNSKTRKEFFLTKRKFDYFQGKYKTFWLSTFNDDIIPLGSITSGGQTLVIATENWPHNLPEFVRIHGDTHIQAFEIDAIVDHLDGTSTLAFIETATAAINNITKIEIMTKVRFNSDGYEYNHPDKVLSSISMPVIEVNE